MALTPLSVAKKRRNKKTCLLLKKSLWPCPQLPNLYIYLNISSIAGSPAVMPYAPFFDIGSILPNTCRLLACALTSLFFFPSLTT
jgi:hypothetical protein